MKGWWNYYLGHSRRNTPHPRDAALYWRVIPCSSTAEGGGVLAVLKLFESGCGLGASPVYSWKTSQLRAEITRPLSHGRERQVTRDSTCLAVFRALIVQK